MGYGRVLLAYQLKGVEFSMTLRNLLESGFERGFERGALQASLSLPIANRSHIFTQYFNGYGQRLIEYNHRTQAFELGLSMSSWI